MLHANAAPDETNPASEDRLARLLDRLSALHPKIIDLSLDRIERLLAVLGNPQDCLPPVVHIAGTNGKGSVLAFTQAIAQAKGLKVHAYTSPHLVRFNERIRLAGVQIADEPLIALLEECEAANAGNPITFFEMTTAAAFLAFSRTPADLLLLETGLGGRLDATNVVARPLVTAITPISHDHAQFLGNTIAKIAGEKAGILKPGIPAVIGLQSDEALQVITDRAAAIAAPLDIAGRDWDVAAQDGKLSFRRGGDVTSLHLPSLEGPHQILNAGIALAICDHIPALKGDRACRDRGLTQTFWPARLQRLTQGPLVHRLPKGGELWLDGGHNEGAGHALAGMAALWQQQDGRPLFLLAGMLTTKDATGFLRPLAPYVTKMAAIEISEQHEAYTPADLSAMAHTVGIDAVAQSSPTEALEFLIESAKSAASDKPPRFLMCGSLYLAGAILKNHT